VLATQPRTEAAIHDFVENGSGLLAAITSFSGRVSLVFWLYDVTDGTTTTNFLTSLGTPGDPLAVVLHRGLAYVAGDDAGLQVINYLPPDTRRQRPDIAFGPPLSQTPTLEAGSSPLLTFITGDDVAVREVDLFADGVWIGGAGSFPFQIPVAVAPPPPPGQTSVVLRAPAVDTGGNERWTDEFQVARTPDHTPPIVRLLSPTSGAELPPGGLSRIVVGFNEPMTPTPLLVGEYLVCVTPKATDVYGDPIASEVTSRFGVHGSVSWALDADGRWDLASNWSPARPIAGDDVRIDRPAATVVISHTTGNSLVSGSVSTEGMRLTVGSLALHSNSLIRGPLFIQGATLSNRAELSLTGATAFVAQGQYSWRWDPVGES